MENISFVRYSPHTSKDELTMQVVECYRQVFADKPWNEWKQCPKCKKYWGIRDQILLQSLDFWHCNTAIVDFWPKEQVATDLFHEITEEASCWLAMSRSKVIGFCWGYPIVLSDLEKKLGLKLDSEITRHLGHEQPVAYQDEVGVLSEYRGQKIAKTMIKHRLEDFLSQGLKTGIVRTRQNPKPSETFLWYQKLGYTTIATYPSNDGRVVQGRNFNDLYNLLL